MLWNSGRTAKVSFGRKDYDFRSDDDIACKSFTTNGVRPPVAPRLRESALSIRKRRKMPESEWLSFVERHWSQGDVHGLMRRTSRPFADCSPEARERIGRPYNATDALLRRKAFRYSSDDPYPRGAWSRRRTRDTTRTV